MVSVTLLRKAVKASHEHIEGTMENVTSEPRCISPGVANPLVA